MNLMKSNTKCKVLHLSHGNPKQKFRLDGERTESSPGEKGLGVLVGEELKRTQYYTMGCIKKKFGQQVKASNFAPLPL